MNGLLILMVSILFCCAPVSAIVGTTTRYTGSIAPGGSDTFSMGIGLGPNENPSDISVSVMGFGQAPDSGFVPVDPANDTNPYSARTFISLDKTLLHLKPGTSETVTATINMPKNVDDGGRYAIIYLHAVPSGGGQATITTAIIIPVLITISGTNPTMAGSIMGVSVGNLTVGQPVEITTSFKNTGNYHYRNLVNNVTLTNANGNILAESSAAPWQNSIIPGNTVQDIVQPDVKNLSTGTYTISSKVSLESGQVLDEKTTSFQVTTAYTPPPKETSITVHPGSPATLVSPDGRYSVIFPQGAVLDDVAVTLKPYSRADLQPATGGAALGASSFEITGLSGLLNKNATVRVLYSADDLAAAQGDASLLKLGYWDPLQEAWVILPTQVSTQDTSLTTTTNYLSVWAVMVSSSTTGGAASGAAPTATATQSPLPVSVIFVALIVITILLHDSAGKRK